MMILRRTLILIGARKYNIFLNTFQCSRSVSSQPKEQTVRIGKWNINYVRVGNGDHKVLCVPGALGTIWTDMKPQIEGFDKEKFTVIAIDPPGYGKSRPPHKEFTLDFYDKDADVIYAFIKELGIPKCSLLGWSDGGIAGTVMAAKYPEIMNKLVIWGVNAFILPQEIKLYQRTRDIKSWSTEMRKKLSDVYGEETLAKYWAAWCDGMQAIFEKRKGHCCLESLNQIHCPTFIIHGEKDPLVDNSHVSYLHINIANSRVHLYPEGKHNIHLRYAEDFNQRVQHFLLLPP